MTNMHWFDSRFFRTRFVPLCRGNERNERWSGFENRRNEKKRETDTGIPVIRYKRFNRFFVSAKASLTPSTDVIGLYPFALRPVLLGASDMPSRYIASSS